MLTSQDIAARMGTTTPTTEGADATAPKHSSLYAEFTKFAQFLEGLVPEGRAKAVMHTELESASMWAHKAVAQETPVVQNEVAVAASEADKAITEVTNAAENVVAEAPAPAQQ